VVIPSWSQVQEKEGVGCGANICKKKIVEKIQEKPWIRSILEYRKSTGWKISWKKPCQKTTTEMGQQHQGGGTPYCC